MPAQRFQDEPAASPSPPFHRARATPSIADRGRLAGVIVCLLLLANGCARAPFGNAPLTIATPWSLDERARLEREFNAWLTAHREGDGPLRIDWVVVEPGDDPVRLALAPRRPLDWRPHPLDLLLGGPAPVYAQLARRGQLLPADQPAWRVARRTAIGWARNTKVEHGDIAFDPAAPLRSLSQPDDLAFDDPRVAPVALAWARGVLSATTWAEGYAALVRAAAHAQRIGREPGASRAAVERGEALITPALPFSTGDLVAFVPGPDRSTWVEGVAILRGGDNPSLAEQFLEFLAASGRAETPRADEEPDPEAEAFLADLLGATLVDAQNELVPAWRAWERAGRPDVPSRWLTEAPPWPPASVAKLLKTAGAGPLLDTLTEQVVPDADNRAWLVRSWLMPERRVDGALLTELANAVDGRLAREPRFRAWLRGEWTAWARQRYRRVERQIELARTPIVLGSP